MKTETVEIKNGAGTYRKVIKGLTTVNVRIPPEQIEGQFIPGYYDLSDEDQPNDWAYPDGLYEMEKIEKPGIKDEEDQFEKYDKALTAYRPWRIIKLLDK